MAIIIPTFNLTSNTSTAGTNAGPSAWALALSTTLNATVDLVDQRLITTSTTLNADSSSGVTGPIDGSAFATLSGADADGNDNVTAGTVGGYVYMKNTSTTAAELIYIGIVSSAGATDAQAPDVPAASGTTALDNDTHDTLRTMTLKAGDFAWFPWDYTGDINFESATGTPKLELWIFDRSAS